MIELEFICIISNLECSVFIAFPIRTIFVAVSYNLLSTFLPNHDLPFNDSKSNPDTNSHNQSYTD
jgi:hypothetical protein